MRPPSESGWRYKVGAHETFPFRYGWLKKGFDAIQQDGFALLKDEAMAALGVGKNMVRSIRWWCLATQMAEEMPVRSGPKPMRPTLIGLRMLGDDGWDPYLEDPGSLWLLHWLLVTNPNNTGAWYHIFSSYPDVEFTKKHLVAFLQRIADEQEQPTSCKSIERDVDCFLRTYSLAAHAMNVLPEVALECPLAELEIIRPAGEDGVYRFCIGRKDTLPVQVFGFALLQFYALHTESRRTLSVEECLYAPLSPGQAFRLDQGALVEMLEELEALAPSLITLAETAGVAQIHLRIQTDEDVQALAMGVLDAYYGQEGPNAA